MSKEPVPITTNTAGKEKILFTKAERDFFAYLEGISKCLGELDGPRLLQRLTALQLACVVERAGVKLTDGQKYGFAPDLSGLECKP